MLFEDAGFDVLSLVQILIFFEDFLSVQFFLKVLEVLVVASLRKVQVKIGRHVNAVFLERLPEDVLRHEGEEFESATDHDALEEHARDLFPVILAINIGDNLSTREGLLGGTIVKSGCDAADGQSDILFLEADLVQEVLQLLARLAAVSREHDDRLHLDHVVDHLAQVGVQLLERRHLVAHGFNGRLDVDHLQSAREGTRVLEEVRHVVAIGFRRSHVRSLLEHRRFALCDGLHIKVGRQLEGSLRRLLLCITRSASIGIRESRSRLLLLPHLVVVEEVLELNQGEERKHVGLMVHVHDRVMLVQLLSDRGKVVGSGAGSSWEKPPS